MGILYGASGALLIKDTGVTRLSGLRIDVDKDWSVIPGHTPAWGLADYAYRKRMTIDGSTADAQTDFQMKLIVHKGAGVDSDNSVYLNGHCRDDFNDIRFTQDDGITELDHWRERYVNGDYAVFWIKFNSIPASPSSASFYIHYGNESASSGSDGEAAFVFFDDFPGSLVDGSKWPTQITVPGGSIIVSGGVLILDTSVGEGYARIGRTVSCPCRIEARAKVGSDYDSQNGNRHRWNKCGEPHDIFVGDDSAHTTIQVFWNGWTGTGVDSDTYLRLRQIYSSGQLTWAIYKEDETLIYSNSYVPSSDPTSMFYDVGDGTGNNWGRLTIDWVFVRKHADPEPTWGTWGSEESYTAYYRIENLDDAIDDSDLIVKAQAILESMLTTKGDLLYRGSSGAQRLAPGTPGEFLKTQGVGRAPVWSGY